MKSSTYMVGKNKFISYLFSPLNDLDFDAEIAKIKELHPHAKHVVYAYISHNSAAFSDDREPRGSAGSAIYRLLTLQKRSDLLIVVVRYFGGKLGVGGLTRSYVAAAQQVLNET